MGLTRHGHGAIESSSFATQVGLGLATSKRDMRQRLPGTDRHLISDGPSEACSVWRVRLAAAHADVDAEIDLDAKKENARLPADVRRMRGCLARRA